MTDADPPAVANTGRPLAHHLSMLVASILVPAVVLAGFLIWRVGILDQERTNREALQTARNMSADIDREIDGLIETLVALAASPSLASGDLAVFHRQATETANFRKLRVFLMTPDGQQLVNMRVPYGGDLPRMRLTKAYKDVSETRRPAVSDLVIGAVTKQWATAVSVPVIQGDKVAYILSIGLDPEHIQRILSQSTPPGPEWIVAVSDRTGRLIARSREQAGYVGQEMHPDVRAWSLGTEGVHRTSSLAGEAVVRGYEWSEKSGWITAAFVPTAVVDAPLRNLWRWFAILTAAVLALSLSLAYRFAREIKDPIVAAAKAAYLLGHARPVVVVPSRLLEANELSTALANASQELEERTRALRANEQRYRSVFEQSAVGFKQVTLDGHFLAINDTLCTMLGYTREECLEKSFNVFTHPDDIPSEEALVAKLLSGEIPHYELEKRLLTKSGAPVWVQVTSAVVRDDAGKPLYRTAVVENITERRRAREAAARLASIVQSSQDAIISTSLSGNIETWNPGAEKLFGYTAEEAIGQSISILFVKERAKEFSDNLAAVRRDETLNFEDARRHKDGSPIEVSVTATPIKTHGEITSMSVTMEDIRDRKRREAHILLLNRELAHRVKNTMAVIQSIANQTMRSTSDPRAFRVAFQGRLQALSAANDLLMQTSWGGADLRDFVDRSLAPLITRSSAQLNKDGPSVTIPAETSVHLGLALHELGTNALKSGAWSMPGGQVQLTCKS